jgi:aminomethyltransferase
LHNNFDARIEDISNETSLLALQGPEALAILQPLTEVSLSELLSFHFIRGRVSSVNAIISRTGYTGEDGFELYFPPNSRSTVECNSRRRKTTRNSPAGLGARNTLRLEAKLLLYGNDMDRTTTLLEAGLGWIVKPAKGDFVGSKALSRQKSEGIRRTLAGFEMVGREIARDHYPILFDGRQVGHVTSGSPSITLKKNIGLGYLPVELAAPGKAIQVSIRNKPYDAQIVSTPFYKRRME